MTYIMSGSAESVNPDFIRNAGKSVFESSGRHTIITRGYSALIRFITFLAVPDSEIVCEIIIRFDDVEAAIDDGYVERYLLEQFFTQPMLYVFGIHHFRIRSLLIDPIKHLRLFITVNADLLYSTN